MLIPTNKTSHCADWVTGNPDHCTCGSGLSSPLQVLCWPEQKHINPPPLSVLPPRSSLLFRTLKLPLKQQIKPSVCWNSVSAESFGLFGSLRAKALDGDDMRAINQITRETFDVRQTKSGRLIETFPSDGKTKCDNENRVRRERPWRNRLRNLAEDLFLVVKCVWLEHAEHRLY